MPLAAVLANPRLAATVSADLRGIEAKISDGRTAGARWPSRRARPRAASYWSMSGGGSPGSDDAAEYATLELGSGPWYGYWYGVILQVVEGVLVSFRSPLMA